MKYPHEQDILMLQNLGGVIAHGIKRSSAEVCYEFLFQSHKFPFLINNLCLRLNV